LLCSVQNARERIILLTRTARTSQASSKRISIAHGARRVFFTKKQRQNNFDIFPGLAIAALV